MSAFILKLIAMITMLIDHVGYRFLGNMQLMRSVGRMAFIVYAFLIAESYFHLRDKPDRLKVHILKLFALCLISEVPFDLFDKGKWFYLPVQSTMFTLTLGFSALIVCGWIGKRVKNRAAALSCCAAVCLLAAGVSYLIQSEYKFAGVLLIVMFYIYLRHADGMKLPARFAALLGILVLYAPIYLWSRTKFGGWAAVSAMAESFGPRFIGIFATAVPMALYDRRLGYRSRWFNVLYSIFYPLQFAVLFAVQLLLSL